MRTLVVGDIQGCLLELLDLLDRAGLSPQDEVVALGDLVDRGPDSPGVVELFASRPAFRSIMGNHEWKHVRWFRGEAAPSLSQRITRKQFGEDRYPAGCRFMADLPSFLELPGAILVHGYLEPGLPLTEQRHKVLLGTMSAERYLRSRYPRPWYELYDGEKPLIVGHHDHLRTGRPFVYRDRVFAIDTGCCFGRTLTGLLLPEFRLISAPSRANYWGNTKAAYFRGLAAEQLSWRDAESTARGRDGGTSRSGADPRLMRVESLLGQAERAAAALFEHVRRENERLLAELRGSVRFDELLPGEQGALYAARAGRTPFAKFLHLARKGLWSPEAARKGFRQPATLVAFARRLGLVPPHSGKPGRGGP